VEQAVFRSQSGGRREYDSQSFRIRNVLQSLRFAAAMMVVYFHAAGVSLIATGSYGLLPRNFQIVGRAGVDIFFVLSGVIIATTARRLTWREFVWRSRIVPMYC
jgi:exopolysaccharide production protein ExoZ